MTTELEMMHMFSKPSKVVRYKAESKHPFRTAYYMCQNGSNMLWHDFDSAECKEWELESENGIVTLSLYYDDIVEGDMYEETIQTALEEFWKRRRTKFSVIP